MNFKQIRKSESQDQSYTKEELLKKVLPSQSFYDLICEITPFNFECDDSEFNNWFLGGIFKEKDILELIYKSSYQKTCFLNYILINIFTDNHFLNTNQSKDARMPEILFIDSSNNFNILAFHSLIQDALFYKDNENSVLRDKEKLEKVLENILAHLHVIKVYDREEFIFTLKSLRFLLAENKQIKLIIIDSVNSFNVFGHYHGAANNESNLYYNFNKTNSEISKFATILKELREFKNVSFIITKKHSYKMNNLVTFNTETNDLEINRELDTQIQNQMFPDISKSYYLLNSSVFDEASLNYIFNDPNLVKKIENFNLKNYTIFDVMNNGNIFFALKKSEKEDSLGSVSELFCYNINKSNFNPIKIYFGHVGKTI